MYNQKFLKCQEKNVGKERRGMKNNRKSYIVEDRAYLCDNYRNILCCLKSAHSH